MCAFFVIKWLPRVSPPSTLSSLPHRSFPPDSPHMLFPTGSPPSTLSSLPTGALPKLFPTVSPPCTLSSFPYRSFPTLLPPNGALPKLFPTVSLPSTLSSFPYRSFPPELSPSYFPRFRKLLGTRVKSLHRVLSRSGMSVCLAERHIGEHHSITYCNILDKLCMLFLCLDVCLPCVAFFFRNIYVCEDW